MSETMKIAEALIEELELRGDWIGMARADGVRLLRVHLNELGHDWGWNTEREMIYQTLRAKLYVGFAIVSSEKLEQGRGMELLRERLQQGEMTHA